MKSFALNIRLLCAVLLFALTHAATGQDADITECPYFNVSSTDTNGVVFSLVSTNVRTTISGVIANVVVEQLYLNQGDSSVDATYVFPMSTNAAIYGMEMDVNDRTIVAEIRRRAEAQEIFENAENAGLTASLLEQHRPNVFQMSLANIRPGDSLRVRMVYTELLVPVNAVYQFVFPNIVGPRFTTNGEPWIYQSIRDSIPLSETELTIDVKINAGMPVYAECPSHAATFENHVNSAQTSVVTNPGHDFIVNYALDDNQIQTGLLLFEDEEENFFLSMIQPPRPDVPFESPAREYVFIMDVSGSMNGEPIAVSKQLIVNMLHDLNSQDRFNIIFFAGGTAVLAPNSLPVTASNIQLAEQMISSAVAGGGTHLLPALQQALNMDGTEDFSRTFVILTDGYVAVEKAAFDLIRQHLNEANFFAFGIGHSVNRYIIEGIAYVGEGEAFVVTDEDDANTMATTFKEYVERPVLTNIEAIFDGIEVYDVEPLTVPDVFAERPVIIYGKYHKPADGSVTVKGDYADGVISGAFNFSDYTANAEENIALKYLWARKKIRLMSDYGIASNENDTISIEEEITLLGLKYSLITEFTSFVAVDSLAVSANSDSEGEDDGGGEYVSVEDHPSDMEKELLTVIGTLVEAGGVLRVQITDLNALNSGDLAIRVSNSAGHNVIYQSFNHTTVEDIISIPLGQLPAGVYFVTLLSKSHVLDTEKFVVK